LGTQRVEQTITWDCKESVDWNDTLPNGLNYKYGDSDGNGLIEYGDTLAVTQNYGLTHPKAGQINAGGNPELYLVFPDDTLIAWQNIDVQVMLGDDTIPVNDIHGIAFTIDYNVEIVDTNTVSFSATTDWMGTIGNDLMGFGKNLSSQDRIDAAVTRIDQNNTTGFGQIGTLHFQVRGDVIGNQTLQLSTSDIAAIDNAMNPIDINGSTSTVNIIATGINDLDLSSSIDLYPNPASEEFLIESSQNISSITLHDLLGKEILRMEELNEQKISVSLDGISSGVYLVKIITDEGEVMKKIVLE